MYLSKHVIKECVENINKDVVGMYIPEIVLGDYFWSRVRRFERSFYDGTIIDAVRFVKKSAFNKIKGFDESLTGPEDWDFDKRIREKGKVLLVKNHLYHDESEFNLKNYLSKKNYYSKSFKKYVEKWGKHDKDVKKQLGPYYRFI